MIFGKSKLELKVGIFVFIGLVILASLVLLIGKIETWRSGYRVHFMFGFINGVKLGAPVRFAGVDVGEVKEMTFIRNPGDNNTSVDIDCWVRREIKIPADSEIWVNTLGLLGEKYIEIMPGKDRVKFLAENQRLIGEDPLPMQEAGKILKDIGTKIEALATDLRQSIVRLNNEEGTVGKLLYDDTLYNELEALVVDIKKHPWKLFYKPKEAGKQ
jgi:phospholipid/cholesterol/gamma-HCH transport system substrate-binding protein